MSADKIAACVEMIREHNAKATIITTPLAQLDGKMVLETIEGGDKLEDMMKEMLEEAEHEHHEHDHHDHDHEHHEHHHDHDHHHEHHHHDGEECCCGHHHHHDHDHEHHDHDHAHHEHHHHDGEECCCGHHHEHGHHHADEVFTSWGMETANKYTTEEIEKILAALDGGEYGVILRAKGMVAAEDGTWIYYDYVPEEHEVRTGVAQVTGKICVIGSNLNEQKLAELFGK